KRLDLDDAGVVQEHVEPAPALPGRIHHALDVWRPRDIRLDGGLAELAGELLGAGAVQVREEEPRAFGGEPARACRADPGGRAGDEGGSLLEASAHWTSPFPVVGFVRRSASRQTGLVPLIVPGVR